jgi:hypothetical protein
VSKPEGRRWDRSGVGRTERQGVSRPSWHIHGTFAPDRRYSPASAHCRGAAVAVRHGSSGSSQKTIALLRPGVRFPSPPPAHAEWRSDPRPYAPAPSPHSAGACPVPAVSSDGNRRRAPREHRSTEIEEAIGSRARFETALALVTACSQSWPPERGIQAVPAFRPPSRSPCRIQNWLAFFAVPWLAPTERDCHVINLASQLQRTATELGCMSTRHSDCLL